VIFRKKYLFIGSTIPYRKALLKKEMFVDFRFRMLAFHGAWAEPPWSTRCGSCMRYDRTSCF